MEATRQIYGQEGISLLGAPPLDSYENLVRSLKSPEFGKDLGGSHKRNAMKWTLAEAKMDIEREKFSDAESACFTQDARKIVF